ncbi:MAG: cobyrinate a,c-diamide synthase [Rhodospirillales bacterium]|nr:cobyrinate a,c-diamide synthase [Rhodospirillales bacterium]
MTRASPPGIVIAAPASGHGKTVFTLALLRGLVRDGIAVSSAKAGPDYIDPRFHAAASGRSCLNLDCWAMRPATIDAATAALGRDADLVVCEGVMGLFDGADGERASTADLAELLGWPVILVVDARAQGASAAAVVRGFASHRPGLPLAGVVFNRVSGDRHAEILRAATAASVPEVPVLGCIPRDPALALPERHLGLVQAAEHADLDRFLDRAADIVAAHVDIERLRGLARRGRSFPVDDRPSPAIPPLGQRIAVAEDRAFQFAYPLVLDGWRKAGAEIGTFSPLAGEAPDTRADAVYLPGGYPELHAGTLAHACGFLEGLRRAAAAGAILFGECGGYMVLGRGLVDADGRRHAMADLLPLETSFADRRLHLGYREAALAQDTPLGRKGARFRGHEFHYARTVAEGPGDALFGCTDARQRDLGAFGLVAGRVMGSFLHLIDRAAQP